MEIIDALKHKGKPYKIPYATREDLPKFYKKMGGKEGVEIGVYKGAFTEILLKGGLKVHGVDPWLSYDDYRHPDGQERMDFIYSHARRQLGKYGDMCNFIRKTSMEAVKDFEDNSIDFVYIDGHHGFRYVAEDIWEWSKKVKPGGIVSGHDWAASTHFKAKDPFTCHVAPVVNAYVEALRMDRFWVIGSDKEEPGERRDTFRSWFWIKDEKEPKPVVAPESVIS